MKTFQYVGGPAQTGVTLKDGTALLMHKGRTYTIDETSEYAQTLLAKKNPQNGFPAPWLVEVPSETIAEARTPEIPESEPEAASGEESIEQEDENQKSQQKRRR